MLYYHLKQILLKMGQEIPLSDLKIQLFKICLNSKLLIDLVRTEKRRGSRLLPHPHSATVPFFSEKSLLNGGLQEIACLEFYYLRGRNLDLLSGLGISPFPCFSLSDRNRHEPGEGQFFPFF